MKLSPNWNGRGKIAFAALALSTAWLTTGRATESIAQYPGHIDTRVKAGPVLRSIAVLEWTGQAGKPSASRLIPVSVFEDGQYQDGGLYLARPEPLALEHGTEYELMQSGRPQGIFDVAMAQQMSGDWYGYGAWKPLPPPAPFHKLKPAKIDADIGDDGGDRKPHFRKASPDSNAAGNAGAGMPPDDPDRPTLRKRPASPATAPDPDTSAAATNGSMETATAGGDPDRPRLTRGIPKDQLKNQPKEPEHLEGTPLNLEQMVAVSDAVTRPEHSFVYSWPSPEDATKMQGLLETIAQTAISKSMTPPASKPAARKPAANLTPAQKASAARRAHLAARKAAVMQTIKLTDEKFNAFELTYSGGATLVFSARTADEDDKARYVTVIAQPDIYGVPQALFTQVTSAADLDATPRLRLVDAVDAAADNRGELLFELRGSTTRQFALYRVASGRVDQMIATGPLPLGKAVAE
jgi:hypothetical protein